MRTEFVKIPPSVLARVTDVHHERNMYAHPNPLARAIFWQRLAVGFRLLSRRASAQAKLLDFGGGSGAFLPALARRFPEVSIVDKDIDDARRVASHYALDNVRLCEFDVTNWEDPQLYDAVVAMDVLEHFADMSVPQRFFAKHLKRDGLLLVSLPTENALYELGRIVLRKSKPADHYHPASELVRCYRDRGYSLLAHRYVPRLGPCALPLFYVGLFRKAV
ncbi:MAG: class I SAM-dependent methyltransferase [Myxococcota bacterium]